MPLAAITNTIDDILLVAVIGLLAFDTVARLCWMLFGAPRWLVTIYRRQQQREVREVLSELGIGDDERETLRRSAQAKRLAEVSRFAAPADQAVRLAAEAYRSGMFVVGEGYKRTFSYFVDVQGFTTHSEYADRAASVLVSAMRIRANTLPAFDLVLGIKDGSPLLAERVASLMRLPLVLFRSSQHPKASGPDMDLPLFDGTIHSGGVALIVDDSTTGGRKVGEAAGAARQAGLKATHCVVLFEPLGKGARADLSAQGIELIAAVTLTDEVLEQIAGLADQ